MKRPFIDLLAHRIVIILIVLQYVIAISCALGPFDDGLIVNINLDDGCNLHVKYNHVLRDQVELYYSRFTLTGLIDGIPDDVANVYWNNIDISEAIYDDGYIQVPNPRYTGIIINNGLYPPQYSFDSLPTFTFKSNMSCQSIPQVRPNIELYYCLNYIGSRHNACLSNDGSESSPPSGYTTFSMHLPPVPREYTIQGYSIVSSTSHMVPPIIDLEINSINPSFNSVLITSDHLHVYNYGDLIVESIHIINTFNRGIISLYDSDKHQSMDNIILPDIITPGTTVYYNLQSTLRASDQLDTAIIVFTIPSVGLIDKNILLSLVSSPTIQSTWENAISDDSVTCLNDYNDDSGSGETMVYSKALYCTMPSMDQLADPTRAKNEQYQECTYHLIKSNHNEAYIAEDNLSCSHRITDYLSFQANPVCYRLINGQMDNSMSLFQSSNDVDENDSIICQFYRPSCHLSQTPCQDRPVYVKISEAECISLSYRTNSDRNNPTMPYAVWNRPILSSYLFTFHLDQYCSKQTIIRQGPLPKCDQRCGTGSYCEEVSRKCLCKDPSHVYGTDGICRQACPCLNKGKCRYLEDGITLDTLQPCLCDSYHFSGKNCQISLATIAQSAAQCSIESWEKDSVCVMGTLACEQGRAAPECFCSGPWRSESDTTRIKCNECSKIDKCSLQGTHSVSFTRERCRDEACTCKFGWTGKTCHERAIYGDIIFTSPTNQPWQYVSTLLNSLGTNVFEMALMHTNIRLSDIIQPYHLTEKDGQVIYTLEVNRNMVESIYYNGDDADNIDNDDDHSNILVQQDSLVKQLHTKWLDSNSIIDSVLYESLGPVSVKPLYDAETCRDQPLLSECSNPPNSLDDLYDIEARNSNEVNYVTIPGGNAASKAGLIAGVVLGTVGIFVALMIGLVCCKKKQTCCFKSREVNEVAVGEKKEPTHQSEKKAKSPEGDHAPTNKQNITPDQGPAQRINQAVEQFNTGDTLEPCAVALTNPESLERRGSDDSDGSRPGRDRRSSSGCAVEYVPTGSNRRPLRRSSAGIMPTGRPKTQVLSPRGQRARRSIDISAIVAIELASIPVPVVGNDGEILPPGWTKVYEKTTGKKYYLNDTTLETSWTRPDKDGTTKSKTTDLWS